jgi:predicted ATPase/DNA-binding SARP family transcriptional activator
MQFSVLGPLEVTEGSASLALGGPRQRSVLALLLLDAGRVVHADRMVTEIWGDEPPDGARDSLYTYISNLRGVIGRDRIVRSDGGYRLVPMDVDQVDARTFVASLGEAHRIVGSDPQAALSFIDESLSAWRGRPYEGCENLPSIVPEAARLEELFLRALEDRIDAELHVGGTPEAGGIEMLTAEHPYRERFWELLARALYRAGRQTDALRALTRLRRTLADDLGLEPSPAISRLEERILLQDPALDAGATPPTNLPTPVSSFIGREEELWVLERLIGDHRLVTVTGPGGAGKTRLAIEVARRIAGAFADGVWFIDLAQVGAAGDVNWAVASSLGVAEPPDVGGVATVVARLRTQSALLVLDNCEHVVAVVADLAETVLEGAPQVRILATSRQGLGVAGEALSHLSGLDTSEDEPEAGDAEQLFAVRAAAVQPNFAIEEANRADVAEICRHLDGMPLAIELAAARVDTLSPGEIVRHLGDRFRLLAGAHADPSSHRSLGASLDWSRDLLDPDDRRAFDQLGVFDGPFTAVAAAAVVEAPSELDAVDILRHLVGASLIHRLAGEVSRYRLLETTRLYARKGLEESGGWQLAVDRHDAHCAGRCRELRGAFFGGGRPEACRTIETEITEYESAFDRSSEGDPDVALEMAWPLGHVWLFSGRIGSGIGRLERLVAATAGATSRARADALAAGAFLLMYVTRYEQATAWADEAIEIYRTMHDGRGLAYALARRGHLAFSVGDVPTAFGLLQESLETCKRIGYAEGTAWPLTLLGQARLWGGDESDEVLALLEEGRRQFIAVGDTYGQMHANMFIQNVGDRPIDVQLRYAEESMQLADEPGADPLIRATALHNLAFIVWNAGERERAKGQLRLSARAALEAGATVASGMAFLLGGLMAGLDGDPERAAVLSGAGHAHFVMEMPPFYIRQLQPGIDAATEALGKDDYDRLCEVGAAMTIEEATDFLLRGT